MKFDLKKPQTPQEYSGIQQWYTIDTKNDNKFFFDTRKDYGLNDLQQYIKCNPTTANILVPFSDTEYTFYKNFIRGDDKPNVIYAEDVLANPNLIAKFQQITLHYIYLGETFLQAKRNQLSEEQIKEIKNRQQQQLDSEEQQMIYTGIYNHYDFQKNVINLQMEYYPETPIDYIKLIYLCQNKEKLTLRQYDLPNRDFIRDLQYHLGFE